MLSKDSPAYVYLLLLYFYLQRMRHVINYHKTLLISKHLNPFLLRYSATQFFAADEFIYNIPKASIVNKKQTLKDGALSEVGQFL